MDTLTDMLKQNPAASPPQPEPRDYLVWSVNWGAWWGPNRGGYTNELSRAGRYTKAEAEEIARVPQHRAGFANKGPSEKAVPLADELAKLPAAAAPEGATLILRCDQCGEAPFRYVGAVIAGQYQLGELHDSCGGYFRLIDP